MNHSYLELKGLRLVEPLRIEGVVLIVPYFEGDKEVAVQRIYLDRNTNKFVKKYPQGSQLGDSYCWFNPKGVDLEQMPNEVRWIVAEGVATALALREIFEGYPIYFACTGGLGRIKRVVLAIQKEYPGCEVMVAGDCGVKTEEILLKMYQETGARFALPKVPEGQNADNWDFCDSLNHYFEFYNPDQGNDEEIILQLQKEFLNSLRETYEKAHAAAKALANTADGPPAQRFAKVVDGFLAEHKDMIGNYEHRHFTDSPSNQKSQIILDRGYLVLELDQLTVAYAKAECKKLIPIWRDRIIQTYGEDYVRVYAEAKVGVDITSIDVQVSDDIAKIVVIDDRNVMLVAGTGSGKTLTLLIERFAPMVRARLKDLTKPQPILFLPSKELIVQVMFMIRKYAEDIYDAVQVMTREESLKVGDSTEDKLEYLRACPGIISHYHYISSKGISDRAFPLAKHIMEMNKLANPKTVHFADEIHSLFAIAQEGHALDSRYFRKFANEEDFGNRGYFTINCKLFKASKVNDGEDRPCRHCELKRPSAYKKYEFGNMLDIQFTPPDSRDESKDLYPEILYDEEVVVESPRLKIIKPSNLHYKVQDNAINVVYEYLKNLKTFDIEAAVTQSNSPALNPPNPDKSFLHYINRLVDIQIHEIYTVLRNFDDEGKLLEERRLSYDELSNQALNFTGKISASSHACEVRVIKGLDPFAFRVLQRGQQNIFLTATLQDYQKNYLNKFFAPEFHEVVSTQPKLKKLFIIRYAKTLDLVNEFSLGEMINLVDGLGGDFLLALAKKFHVQELGRIGANIKTRLFLTEMGFADLAVDDNRPVAYVTYMHHPMLTGTNHPKRRLLFLDCQSHKPTSTFFLPHDDLAWQSANVRDALEQRILDDADSLNTQVLGRMARWVTMPDSSEIDYEADNGGYRMACMQNVDLDATGGLMPLSDSTMRSITDRYLEFEIWDIPPGRNAKKEIYEVIEAFFRDPSTLSISQEQKEAQKAFDKKLARIQKLLARAIELKNEGKTKTEIYDAINLARQRMTKDERAEFWKQVGFGEGND